MNKQFITNCVICSQSDVPALDEMIDNAEDITHEEFKEALDAIAYLSFCAELGYRSGALQLGNDWHVSFHSSKFKGQDCVYCVHSAVEYIFA